MRENNFDLIRICLSLLVLFSHCYPLFNGPDAYDPLQHVTQGQQAFGTLAVDGFFAISGFLISKSWIKSPGVPYIRSRILRIYPGFWVSCIFSVALAMTTATRLLEYVKHLLYNLDGMFYQAILVKLGALDSPAVYSTNPMPGYVNGPQWTLSPEVICYAIVAGMGAIGVLSRRVSTIGFLILWVGYAFLARTRGDFAGQTIFRLAAFFFAGVVIQFYP